MSPSSITVPIKALLSVEARQVHRVDEYLSRHYYLRQGKTGPSSRWYPLRHYYPRRGNTGPSSRQLSRHYYPLRQDRSIESMNILSIRRGITIPVEARQVHQVGEYPSRHYYPVRQDRYMALTSICRGITFPTVSNISSLSPTNASSLRRSSSSIWSLHCDLLLQ